MYNRFEDAVEKEIPSNIAEDIVSKDRLRTLQMVH